MNDERRKQTEQKLIRSGRAEFLEKGYAKANLRDICKAARVTTGAFYFSFENKEPGGAGRPRGRAGGPARGTADDGISSHIRQRQSF
ncbi:MAG: TetR family transcriptional regulator [Blautia sp.]